MVLSPGTLLGPYEIDALIGSGGMGHVYKARDPRLNRPVAIKQLTRHSERFEREARAIAALNHPNICQVTSQCLAKSPADRFQSMTDVKAALEGALAGREMEEEEEEEESQPSIAVLPFANLSPDRDYEYFCDGLADEVITALARVAGLKVIARTSAFAFKGKLDDVWRIAQSLNVTNVLEGSVRRAGDRVRVSVQLIAARDGTNLWSDRYDRSISDVFAMQDEIAQAIASALQVTLVRPAAARHTPAAPAYEAVLRGRHHLYKFTPEAWARAKAWFEQAIALDPEYAEPHAQLGLGYFISGMHGIAPMREVVATIRAEAERALQLEPSQPQPRFLLGAVAAAYDYDWPALLINASQPERAIEEALKARELDEHYFVPHYILGEAYFASGRLAEAIESIKRAYRLAPWNAITAGLLAGTLWLAGDHARSGIVMREMGDDPQPVWGRVLCHLLRSELEAAADWYEIMIERRDPFAIVFANSLITSALRQHPRWRDIAKMMRLVN